MAQKLTSLQEFKLKIIHGFIDWNTNDEIDTNTRSLLFANAINFVENEDSGFPMISEFVQDLPTPNEGLVTWDYIGKGNDTQKAVKIRKATRDDQEGDCFDNVSQIMEQLVKEGVIGFDIEENLKWK